ncbi:MAG: DNA topoisomerase IB [Bacteroidota bacterium]
MIKQQVFTMEENMKAAHSVKLVYVSDKESGISRAKSGSSFKYIFNKKAVSARHLERIRKLVIPPAWTNVWICPKENGHIQCTGYDVKGRKQYRYHSLWIDARSETKFSRMIAFGEILPLLRMQVEHDLKLPDLSEEKVLALVVSLMENTLIRVGNSSYEKMYGSYGLTTLKDKHVKILGSSMEFSFKGKKGVDHKISIKDQRLARMVKQCRDIPGKELFQYKNSDGSYHTIDSGMVNNYIKRCCGNYFTAKDFRTWAGSLYALTELYQAGLPVSHTERDKAIIAAIDGVSNKLGNTRTVCKKYYINPVLIEIYVSGKIGVYFEKLNKGKTRALKHFSSEEDVLLKLLKKECRKSLLISKK